MRVPLIEKQKLKLKINEINITQFKSIEELYSFVDTNSFEFERNYQLTDVWLRFKNQTNVDIEKKQSQWEIDCYSFDLKSGILFSQIYSEGKNLKEIYKYPDLDKFQNEVVEYVKFRISTTQSSLLKARYNHLLWKCPSGIKQTK